MKNHTMKFVHEIQNHDTRKPVVLKFDTEHAREDEQAVLATDGETTAWLIGIRSDGTIVFYTGQKEKLKKLGFQTSERGYVKVFNTLEDLR